ncbi:S9 family peptidase [Daejeonella sp.]|uniref:alpha/beta hydrolase family protein n=1 Tax=Daejeonella sp. TaxID=2805397 RepID=UPI0027B9CB08|nr:prolyl oligopeptidase family serine peptidase [Daejeonella sp.]
MRYFSSLTYELLMILTILIASTSAGNAGLESRLKLANKQSPRLLALKIPISTTWNGFEIIEFKFDGVDAKIVFPNQSNKAKNWIWRTQFWGHEPQTDIALLNKGFHLVYVDVVDLYGNKVAVKRLNAFYTFLIKNFGLNKKTVLEGMSRGGLDAYNWASENTDKVFCIYADAPVCDIRSWPGGLGKGEGSKNDWLKCLQAYGLTELTVKEFKDIPINTCVKLAKAKIPLISVCGDADTVVPIDENTYKLAAVYKEAGGEIELIIKKGIGHHPHSLKDPMPIVDFILKNTRN